MLNDPNADDGKMIFSGPIREDNGGITDRCLRKRIAAGKFPRPDGNLNGRNFWLLGTYRRWKADVFAGKFRQGRRPGHFAPPKAQGAA